MTASIGVFPYSAPYAIAYRDKGQMIIEGLGGTTTTPTLPYIVLHLNNYVGLTGVYPIDSTGENGAEYVTGQTEFLFSRIGTIVITSASQDRIKGSFTFLCSDSTMVNSGDFDAAIKN